MAFPAALTPSVPVLSAWQNWVLVAVVLFLTGVVFHLIATYHGASNNVGEN